jgi:hypothetical protein
MIGSRGFKQITKHLFFLLQITEMCPSICESTKEEVEEGEKEEEEDKVIEEAVPSGLQVTSVDHHNQQACR